MTSNHEKTIRMNLAPIIRDWSIDFKYQSNIYIKTVPGSRFVTRVNVTRRIIGELEAKLEQVERGRVLQSSWKTRVAPRRIIWTICAEEKCVENPRPFSTALSIDPQIQFST